MSRKNLPKLRKIIKELIKIKKNNRKPVIPNEISQLERISDYFDKRNNFSKGICLAGYNYFHITNFGEVTVCGKGPKLNIKDKEMNNIWLSPNFWLTRLSTLKCDKPCLNNCFELI